MNHDKEVPKVLTKPTRMLGALCLVAVLACGPSGREVAGPEVFSTPAGSTSEMPAEREALMQADRDFAQAFADRGVEGWVSFFDERGIQMPGGTAAAWGRDEVRTLAGQLFEGPNFSALTWEPVYAQVAASEDLGFTLGNYHAEGTNEKGEAVVQEGNYVTIWRKQEDGSWKVAFDTGNPGPPLRVPAGWEE